MALRMEAGGVIRIDCQVVKDYPSSTQITRNKQKSRKAMKEDAINAIELAIQQKTAQINNLNQPKSR